MEPGPILTISLSGTAADLSRELSGSLPDKRRLLEAAARAVSNAVHDHFQARDATATHREGFPRSGYWADAAASVHVDMEGDARATISAHAPGLRLHYKGGTVLPVKAKSLALPLRGEVAGVNPREYTALGHMLFVVKKENKAILYERRGHEITPLWLLLRSVHHHPDPTVLPTPQTLTAAIRTTLP